MANPGDTVYTIGTTRVDATGTRCTVEVRYGVLDKNGNVAYRMAPVTVDLASDLAATLRTAVASLVASHLPAALAGAVPA